MVVLKNSSQPLATFDPSDGTPDLRAWLNDAVFHALVIPLEMVMPDVSIDSSS